MSRTALITTEFAARAGMEETRAFQGPMPMEAPESAFNRSAPADARSLGGAHGVEAIQFWMYPASKPSEKSEP
jgi:hypothetical protein